MWKLTLTLAAAALLGLPALTGSAMADTDALRPAPVDPTVSDLDPLSHSHRWLDPNNTMHSPRVRTQRISPSDTIFALPGHDRPPQYRYSAPGVQAMFDRPDYVTRTGPGRHDFARNVSPRPDGALAELVPAGTVYDLRPEAALRHLIERDLYDHEGFDEWEDTRVDHRYRLDARVGTRFHERIDGGSDSAFGQGFDRRRHPHIPPDTPIPSRLPRHAEPEPEPER